MTTQTKTEKETTRVGARIGDLLPTISLRESEEKLFSAVADVECEVLEDDLRTAIDNMKQIVIYELDQGHGSFLTAIFDAYVRADFQNSVAMLPLMVYLTEKYHLKNGVV